MTADDFVFSFRRLVDPATAAEYASMLYVVQNAEAVNAKKAQPEELGVKAIDAETFEVTLNAPTPYFLEMLTHQATYPVHAPSIEKLGADLIKPGNLVSNGAYTLAEFVPNDHIKLVKNPKFYDAANVKIDVVNYIPTEDRSTAMKRFEAGELDSNDDIPTEQLADLKAKFGDQVHIGPYLGTYYYAFKTDKEPWDNAKLRHAISMAIDRDFLAEKVWQNTMIPAYSMVPPGIAGYETGDDRLCRDVAARPRGRGQEDPDRARLRARQAAEDGDPLQHLGEPQEHRGRHPGAAEAARHRGDAAQHRHQDPLRLSSSRRATSTSPAPAGSPTTRTRRTSSASRARRHRQQLFATTTTRNTTT